MKKKPKKLYIKKFCHNQSNNNNNNNNSKAKDMSKDALNGY